MSVFLQRMCVFISCVHHANKSYAFFKLVLNIAIFLSSETKLHVTQVNSRLMRYQMYVNMYLHKAEEARKLNLILITFYKAGTSDKSLQVCLYMMLSLSMDHYYQKRNFGQDTWTFKEVMQGVVFSLDLWRSE